MFVIADYDDIFHFCREFLSSQSDTSSREPHRNPQPIVHTKHTISSTISQQSNSNKGGGWSSATTSNKTHKHDNHNTADGNSGVQPTASNSWKSATKSPSSTPHTNSNHYESPVKSNSHDVGSPDALAMLSNNSRGNSVEKIDTIRGGRRGSSDSQQQQKQVGVQCILCLFVLMSCFASGLCV